MKKITHQEYLKRVENISPNIKVIGHYINANTPITHYCILHNIYWETRPANILAGQLCKMCGIEKRANTQRKTHEQYVEEVYKINPNIIVKETYKGAKIPIMHKCKKHNIEWNISPSGILQGYGCYKCKSEKIHEKQVKSHLEYIKELSKINKNIVPIEKYIGANTPILHKCLIDNYEWESRPANLLNNNCECPKCSQRFRRKHDDYVLDLLSLNPNIEVIDKFINMKTPILHRCKKHNVIWKTAPSNIIYQNCGCVECGKEKIKIKSTKTHIEYVEELRHINPNIEVVGNYIGANISILHRCLIDGYEWNTQPLNTLSGKGCPKCAGNIKRTHEEYVKEVSLVNSNIEVIGEYINSNTPILHLCKKHNVRWNAYPSWVLQGCGCYECGIEKSGDARRKTHEQYVEELKQTNSNIVVLEKYINSYTPILHKCLIDDYEWLNRPGNILSGQGCPKCAGNLKKTQEQYIEDVSTINPNVEVVGEYINARTPIRHKCKLDGFEWNVIPSSILRGSGCPQCFESSGERLIRQWLEKHNIIYIFQKQFKDCCDIKPLPFDFYLPAYNSCIEYDHKQHFEPIEYFGGQEKFKIQQKHDNIKNEYCENNGISLLRIPYYKNIEEELNNFLFI